MAPVPVPFPDHDEGAPGPSHLGTGETVDLNWQEEARGLAWSGVGKINNLFGVP